MNTSKSSLENRKVAAITLGCRLNQADTGLIMSRLARAGCEIIDLKAGTDPQIIVVNTCAVTSSASQKSRQAARSLREKFPDCIIVAAGCSSVIEKEKWRSDLSVDLILDNEEKKQIDKHILALVQDKHIPSPGKVDESLAFVENASAFFPFRSRAFLKIQEGCNSKCTYCIVPSARGKERSRRKEEVLCEFRSFIQAGFKEIVIAGVNICAYQYHGCSISQLIEELSGIPGDFRIRLSSTEPHPETHRILEVMKDSGKICRFLHLPLQHGTDEILKAMNRRYRASEFAEFANKAASLIPGIHIGTDIITGFPGETEELFEKSCAMIKSLPLANLHIFRFSPREGTPAANFADQIPQRISKERSKILGAIEEMLSENFINTQIGQTLPVLIEKTGALPSGWSDNYLKVFSTQASLPKNSIVKLRVIGKKDKGTVIGTTAVLSA